MAVAYGGSVPAITPATSTGTTSASWTISGSDLAIVVYIGAYLSGVTVSSVTWSLGSGTPYQVGTLIENTTDHVFIWAIPAPTAGSGTLTVTLSGSCPWQISASYFTGADQTTPGVIASVATSNSTAASVALTATGLTANDADVGAATNSLVGDITGITPNQTFLNQSTTINLGCGYALGNTAVTFAGAGRGTSTNIVARIQAATAVAPRTATVTAALEKARTATPVSVALSVSTQHASPIADVANPGSWTDQAGGSSDLHSPLVSQDASYDQSPLAPVNAGFTVTLATLSTPDTGTRTLHLKVQKDGIGNVIDLTVNLRDSAGTLIQAFSGGSLSNISDTETQVDLTVTNAISSYTGLRVEILANQSA